LTLEHRAAAQTVYLFKDRGGSVHILVEDDLEAERLASEMIAAGVPVVDVDTD